MSRASDRALHDISGAFDAARPGGVDDIPVAGTAVLLRDGDAGPEALLIHRPERGSFAGAWVFPGGKVEPSDRRAGATEADDARRAAVRETSEEVGVVVDARALTATSCWVPPPGIRKRIRTWFYVARADDTALRPSADEVVATRWARPEDLLAQHGRGELTLYPPTWVTLHALRGADVAALLAAVRRRGVQTFASLVRTGPAGPVFLWRPDAAYDPAVALDAVGPRHRLDAGTLPWTYARPEG